EQVRQADLRRNALHWRLAKRLRPVWRDHLLLLTRKAGERRRYYPPSLYQRAPGEWRVGVELALRVTQRTGRKRSPQFPRRRNRYLTDNRHIRRPLSV